MAIRWLGRNTHLEKSLVDEFVVVTHVFFAGMIDVHLEGEKGELKCAGDESKCLGGILLLHSGCIYPSTFCQGFLNMLGLLYFS